MTDPFEVQLAHLVSLAVDPGWKAYAWSRAKELENEDSGLWAGMSERLRQAVQEQQRSSPPR